MRECGLSTLTMWPRTSMAALFLAIALAGATGALAFIPQVSNPSTDCSGVYAVTISLECSWETDGTLAMVMQMKT